MRLLKLLLLVLFIALQQSCEQKPQNTWQERPFVNAFGEQAGTALYIKGEMLSEGLESAELSFALNQDLISGGYKQVFTFVLHGTSTWSEDYIEIITPNGESHLFDIYDGLLFNIDYESNEVTRFIEFMNFESLEISSGKLKFTISTSGFIELYSKNFLQPNM